MKYLVIIALTILFAGCATQRKAEKFYKKHPVELAKKCATEFPVRDSLIKGDTIINYDTLWGLEYRTDTLISEPKIITETKTVTVPKLVTKYVTVRDTIVRENTAKISVLNSQIAKSARDIRILTEKTHELSQERDTFKHERDKWKLRFFLLLFGVGLIYAAKVKFTKKLW